MTIHAKKKELLLIKHESLGHLKLHLDDLTFLVNKWKNICGSVSITLGDSYTVDLVEDLADISNSEISQLVIQTENPAVGISLQKNRAELSYISTVKDSANIDLLRTSLAPYKIYTTYYRLRSFFWSAYLFLGSLLIIASGKINVQSTLSLPLLLSVMALIVLLTWFLYSSKKLRNSSSTKLLRGKSVLNSIHRAKSLTYWIFPPVTLVLGIALGNHLHNS